MLFRRLIFRVRRLIVRGVFPMGKKRRAGLMVRISGRTWRYQRGDWRGPRSSPLMNGLQRRWDQGWMGRAKGIPSLLSSKGNSSLWHSGTGPSLSASRDLMDNIVSIFWVAESLLSQFTIRAFGRVNKRPHEDVHGAKPRF